MTETSTHKPLGENERRPDSTRPHRSLTPKERLQIESSGTNVRWLYDVRDKIFRFYLIVLAATVGIVRFGNMGVDDPMLLVVLIIFIVVSVVLARQIWKQRQMLDREKFLIGTVSDDHFAIPALFRPNTRAQVLGSTTLGYIRLIVFFASAAGGLGFMTVKAWSGSLYLNSLTLVVAALVTGCAIAIAEVIIRKSIPDDPGSDVPAANNSRITSASTRTR